MTGHPVGIRPAERVLARVIIVVLTVGVAAAVLPVVADPVMAAIRNLAPDETAKSSPQAAVVPQTAPPPAPPPAAPRQPAPTAPPEPETVVIEAPPTTTPPTTAPPTTTTTAVPGSVPPAAGTYPYRLRYKDDEESMEASGRMVVQAAREAEGQTRQTHVYTDEVYGTYSEAFAWQGDGIYLRSVDDGSGAEGNSCDFEPDVLVFPLPLTVGHEWKVDSGCAGDRDAERFTTSSKVVRTDRIAVGGEEVDVFVITSTMEGTDEDGSFAVTETVYFAPSVGLDVRTETDYRFDENDGPAFQWREEHELKALEPQ